MTDDLNRPSAMWRKSSRSAGNGQCVEVAAAFAAARVEDVPNPGSEAAAAAGCLCATLDNCRGKFAPRPPDGWWITEGCPLHDGPRAAAD